ncbi:PssD/Cps14F family polysaccharide biosynthesis glycosyltransferase [Cyanobium gracile]|uniref:PssD/Cps14F family polysaccharide biosynthesis glycosyltransferase n=1 Tax=Cyanobium gracile UHCC 0281 TaxID=3110309 RepID=A0ABU5SZ06_9CYAN|nr:PssD/Cps14F family polysaccharide biosynthesis glycosyltransferase [Cyanobium gracile]MEA5443729.1 PssD/Cps14F family polysaccharide biosynthesis glycosyltransferase [Cyanobium gracile UHCC 0281]
MQLLLVCSSGGHFKGLFQLEPFWRLHQRSWVSFDSATTRQALEGEQVSWAYSPTNRHLPNLLRNALLAWTVLRRQRPDVILSTGAGVAVPFLILGKLLGHKTVFVESITRIETLSLSARLVLPFLDLLYVHWPQLQARYPRAVLITSLSEGAIEAASG